MSTTPDRDLGTIDQTSSQLASLQFVFQVSLSTLTKRHEKDCKTSDNSMDIWNLIVGKDKNTSLLIPMNDLQYSQYEPLQHPQTIKIFLLVDSSVNSNQRIRFSGPTRVSNFGRAQLQILNMDRHQTLKPDSICAQKYR